MKFILMMHGNKAEWDSFAKWSKQDLQRNMEFMRTFSKELKDAGVFVGTEGLAWPDQARLVRAGKDGEPVTDGIFPESKEFCPSGLGLIIARFWGLVISFAGLPARRARLSPAARESATPRARRRHP